MLWDLKSWHLVPIKSPGYLFWVTEVWEQHRINKGLPGKREFFPHSFFFHFHLRVYLFFNTSLGNLALERSSVVDRIFVTTLAVANCFIYIQQSTILDLGIKEYLRIFYSSFFVKRIFILLIYLSRRRKKLERGFLMYYFFLLYEKNILFPFFL